LANIAIPPYEPTIDIGFLADITIPTWGD